MRKTSVYGKDGSNLVRFYLKYLHLLKGDRSCKIHLTYLFSLSSNGVKAHQLNRFVEKMLCHRQILVGSAKVEGKARSFFKFFFTLLLSMLLLDLEKENTQLSALFFL